MDLHALVRKWLQEAEALEQRYLDERAASLFRLHASELEEAIREHEDGLLTLSQAASESGYSIDHLRHLVADGSIPNAGKRGSPLIRRTDLPLKPGSSKKTSGGDPAGEASDILRSLGPAA